MNRGTAFFALWSHWRRHPGQLLTLLSGLALATALWSGVQAINAEARTSYDRAASALGQDQLDRLEPDSGTIPQEVYVALRRAGWAVTPVVEGQIIRDAGTMTVLGIDPLTAPPQAQMVDLSAPGDLLAFIQGELYGPPDLVADLEGVLDGGSVQVAASLPPRTLLGDIGTAQTLLKEPGEITRLLVLNEQPLVRQPLSEFASDLQRRPPDGESDIARLTDSFHLNLTAFGLLSFAVGLFIVHAAIGLAFEQRRPMFRTLRALGVPGRTLIGLLAAEVLAVALFAGAVGVLLGYLIAAALLPNVAATLRGLYGASVDGTLNLEPIWWLSGLLIAVVGASVAAAQALWRVWRLPLLAPAQPRAWARQSERGLKAQIGFACLCVVVALSATKLLPGLAGGFVMLGGLLVAAALALPLVLTLLLGAAQGIARGPVLEWFWADTRQQLPGLSLALMALLLALAANIGVGTMVSSFRQTFTGWLDQRLASELYVTARSAEEAKRLRAFLEDRADAVLPIWRTEGRIAGNPAEIYGVADHMTYRENWPMLDALPEVWDMVARGEGVLINEQLSYRAGMVPGDDIGLPAGWTGKVAGIYSDYGNPKVQVLVGIDRFTSLYPDAPRLRFGIRTDPALVEVLMSELVEDFGLPTSAMVDQATIKAASIRIFERTFSVTAALNVLTLGVAGFAMLTSLLTLSAMRLPQLAPVWALGLTRAQLARFEFFRAGLLGALTAVLAVPVGLGLAWVLLNVVNVEAFGWKLPMFLFPSDWLVLGILSVFAALLAAIYPVRRLARTRPSQLLKVFADER